MRLSVRLVGNMKAAEVEAILRSRLQERLQGIDKALTVTLEIISAADAGAPALPPTPIVNACSTGVPHSGGACNLTTVSGTNSIALPQLLRCSSQPRYE